ncbi:DUF3293 domain-containing protein [Permianibacter sp. IMCC34836]|uniref:DUF3293 domain-containing protein n=1 Tax=Permianibacter fluminis TaxID=2738515 RepID=UPI00155504BB|nr:DUF3293 domain-containing protein [Permianibacter fluminis]NQD37681.1 DUF3293 domain-containing protein [Permianibacter fluminis]
MLAPELLQAYLDSHYRIAMPGDACVLQIGKHSPAMDALLHAEHSTSAAFISACNPCSRQLPAAINRSRNAALEQLLLARKLRYFPGVGYSTPTMPAWPPEPGFLILTITRQQARQLGAQFDQHALLFVEPGLPVELLFCQR